MSLILLDSSGNIKLDADGKIRVGAAGDPCCCGCTDFTPQVTFADITLCSSGTVYDPDGNPITVSYSFSFNPNDTFCLGGRTSTTSGGVTYVTYTLLSTSAGTYSSSLGSGSLDATITATLNMTTCQWSVSLDFHGGSGAVAVFSPGDGPRAFTWAATHVAGESAANRNTSLCDVPPWDTLTWCGKGGTAIIAECNPLP